MDESARDIGGAKHFAMLERKQNLSRRPDGAGLASRDETDVCDVMPSCAMEMTEAHCFEFRLAACFLDFLG
jgi:hypothetical protein